MQNKKHKNFIEIGVWINELQNKKKHTVGNKKQ
jgi:hypothetical protein